MDKLMLFFQRRDGLSSSEFHRHYLETHAPMATAWARVIHRYVVNLTDQPPQPLDSLGFTDRTEGGFDAITEAWVDSVPDFFDDRKCFADPEQARKMAADHHSFIGTMHGYRVSEELTENERRHELVFLRLRQTSGIHYEDLLRLCGEEAVGWIEHGVNEGWLQRDGSRVAFTPAGFLVSSELISQLF